jgi:hypothetical protein
MKGVGQVACMEETKCTYYIILVEKPEGKGQFG